MLIEAAKLAPRYNLQLAVVHERELKRGIAIGRRWQWRANWWLFTAVDRSGEPFQVRASSRTEAA